MEYNIGDIVKTKKKHPCGSFEWDLIGIGVNFKMKCRGCGHLLLIDREKAKKIITKKL